MKTMKPILFRFSIALAKLPAVSYITILQAISTVTGNLPARSGYETTDFHLHRKHKIPASR